MNKEVGEYSDLTSWNRAVLVNLIVPQLVKKFPTLYGPERLTTISTPACWVVPILSQLNPFHTLLSYLFKYILILSSHLPVGIQVASFLYIFQSILVWIILLTHTHHFPHPSNSSWSVLPTNIQWWADSIKLLIMYFPSLLFLICLWSKYLTQIYKKYNSSGWQKITVCYFIMCAHLLELLGWLN